MRSGRNGGLLKTGGRNPGSGRPRNPEWLLTLRAMERRFPGWNAWVQEVMKNPGADVGFWLDAWEAVAAVAYDEPTDPGKLVALVERLARNTRKE